MTLRYLTFTLSEDTDGISTLDAMASTRPESHAEVMREVQNILDWAHRRFPDRHGPIEDGMAWNHDLLVQEEDGGWHTVTLSLAGSPQFIDAFAAEFGDAMD
ncbi:hypothetical protein DZC73_02995 [Albitalea terrae]|uniref:Uncharacterized protein n=1 Tax=Piscinibacter terrae TaxID=2496871 RepID=A0A3N7J7R7_9BURK|nr:hypothetical protein DZC73_02995 [Albitalea terrae]